MRAILSCGSSSSPATATSTYSRATPTSPSVRGTPKTISSGRKVADSVWAVYASRNYVERHGKPERIEDLPKHRLVGLDEAMRQHRAVTWLNSVAPPSAVVARSNSILGLVQAVKSGLGLGPLPTAIADEQAELVQVLGPISDLSRSWRILTPSDLRHTHRISTFFDFITEEREALKRVLTG